MTTENNPVLDTFMAELGVNLSSGIEDARVAEFIRTLYSHIYEEDLIPEDKK